MQVEGFDKNVFIQNFFPYVEGYLDTSAPQKYKQVYFLSPLQPINDSIQYSLNTEVSKNGIHSPEPRECSEEDEILHSSELGSRQSLISKTSMKQNLEHQLILQKSNSMASLRNHEKSASGSRNDTPQSIPLADLDDELKISDLSLISSQSYGAQSVKSFSAQSGKSVQSISAQSMKSVQSISVQSIKSYNGSIKVRIIF